MTPSPHFTRIHNPSPLFKNSVKSLEFVTELYKDENGILFRKISDGEWEGVAKNSPLYTSLEEAYQKTKREAKLKRIANET